jgi:hypothetical protein
MCQFFQVHQSPPWNLRASALTPRIVVTPYALELSWLFESLRDAFYADNLLDGQSRIEFFGRRANAVDRCLKTL